MANDLDDQEADEDRVVLVSRWGDGQTEKVLHFIDDDGDGLYLATSDDLALTDLAGEWAGPVEPPLSGQSR